VLAADWFDALDRPWGRSLLDDQYVGASIGWVMGEYPILIMAIALIAGWVRADRRERRRYDRQEERGGDKELTAYNSYLSKLAEADLTHRRLSPTMEPRNKDPQKGERR
jgi:putative copper resistance protein D